MMKQRNFMLSDVLSYILIYGSSLIVSCLIIFIVGYICIQAIPHFNINILLSKTSIIKNTVGILPNIINTLYIIVLTLLISAPVSIGGAIYLNEYAKNKKIVNIITLATEVLAGIPSIIYGLFGMLFFGEVCGLSYSLLTGALTLSIMILPIITRNTQNALDNVPYSYKEAALGLGTSKWHMIKTILLPSALPGILTGMILSIGRIIAESAALLFTAGSLDLLPDNLFTHMFSSGGTLSVQLYLEMAKANYDTAFVIAMILVFIVLGLNYLVKLISNCLKVG